MSSQSMHASWRRWIPARVLGAGELLARRGVRPALGCMCLAALPCAVLTGCGGDSTAEPSTPVPSSVHVSPGSARVTWLQDSAKFTAEVRDAQGAPVPGAAVVWTSLDAAIASVDHAGIARALAPGTARIQAAAGNVTGAATLVVDQEPQDIVLTPDSARVVSLQDTVRFTAVIRDAGGAVIPGVAVTWTALDAAIAAVDSAGVALALAPGTARIQAAAGEAIIAGKLVVEQEVAAVMIDPPAYDTLIVADTLRLAAVALDANGFPVIGADLLWASSDEGVATVDAAGLLRGVGSGDVEVTASQDAVMDLVGLTVRYPALVPAADTVLAGDLRVATLVIRPGVTVTTATDLYLHVEGPAEIAGNLTGDCTGMAIVADGAISVTGQVRNVCSDSTAADRGDLALIATGSLVLDGAEITSSGTITIGNDPTIPFPGDGGDGPPFTAGLRASAQPHAAATASTNNTSLHTCVLAYTELSVRPVRAHSGADGSGLGGLPGSGAGIDVFCSGTLTLRAAVLVAQWGGHGGSAETHGAPAFAYGRDGGDGGSVRLGYGGLVVKLVVEDGPSVLRGGHGGLGGSAVAVGVGGTGAAAARAFASGGNGGRAGFVSLPHDVEYAGGSLSAYRGKPGDGGSANAYGEDGQGSAGDEPAQAGGRADAAGGRGGGQILSLQPGDPVGDGGWALARGGHGGRGGPVHRSGANGGDMAAVGGTSPTGGIAGRASFAGGAGGEGAANCPAGQGGDGGTGGAISSNVDGRFGASLITILAGAGNGGAGGDGDTPGAGGLAGVDSSTGQAKEIEPNALQPGQQGGPCTGTG